MDINYSVKTTPDQTTGNTRLQVWVNETSDNVPSEIFLYRTIPLVEGITEVAYQYYGVCSYADMINYSADSNDTSSNFYRKASIDMLFESAHDMGEFIVELSTDIQHLVDDICKTHIAAGTDVSFNGSLLDVTMTLKHVATYSYLLTLVATQPVFVVEDQSDGSPEFVSVASLADMVRYGITQTSGFYRTANLTLCFTDQTTYDAFKTALDADLAALNTDLSFPGVPNESTTYMPKTSADVTTPTTFYFGE